jgi:hypothetical protein
MISAVCSPLVDSVDTGRGGAEVQPFPAPKESVPVRVHASGLDQRRALDNRHGRSCRCTGLPAAKVGPVSGPAQDPRPSHHGGHPIH